MNVLVFQLDGKMPNLATMRIVSHHRALGHEVEFRRVGNATAIEPRFGDPAWDAVYASLIFESTKPLARRLIVLYPNAVVGGTGWSLTAKIGDVGIDEDTIPDYSDWPRYTASLGFSQRGCRLACKFCVVPRKEGKISQGTSVDRIWRGGKRDLVLLDNDFFGNPQWPEVVDGQQPDTRLENSGIVERSNSHSRPCLLDEHSCHWHT